MSKIATTSRPISQDSSGFLLLEGETGSLEKYFLEYNSPVLIEVIEPEIKHCTGWYDIMSHTNYVCDNRRTVDKKYESCFECRKKTGFNPAFYNTEDISGVQAQYNNTPHSVYIAYFGNGLAKAGIMADSRGIERIYEQGALFYCIIGSFENATVAHNLEAELIRQGLRNSVTKTQKERVLTAPINSSYEHKIFSEVLNNLALNASAIISNLDHFFFGTCPAQEIQPIENNPISGTICGIVGRYLILSNNGHFYGYWLTNLTGYRVAITDTVLNIDSKPIQISLFG